MKEHLAYLVYFLLGSAFGLSAHSATEFCGLGPPPNAPNYADFELTKAAHIREKGFLPVCEADLKRFNIDYRKIDVDKVELDFSPVSIENTPFTQLKSLGLVPEVVGEKKSRLYRGFRTPEGYVVTLFEHDMSADGSSAWRKSEDEPERVNGMPARLVVLEASSGNAISLLSWIEKRRSYEVWINVNVARQPWRERFFALAASLPPSTAACPKEIPPKPFRLGLDGLPESGPLPKIMTQMEVDKLFPKVRPCK